MTRKNNDYQLSHIELKEVSNPSYELNPLVLNLHVTKVNHQKKNPGIKEKSRLKIIR